MAGVALGLPLKPPRKGGTILLKMARLFFEGTLVSFYGTGKPKENRSLSFSFGGGVLTKERPNWVSPKMMGVLLVLL